MIRIALIHAAGVRTGRITLGEGMQAYSCELATWHRAGEGLMLATTTAGERVTLATADDGDGIHGSMTIGNTQAARRWTIRGGVRDGATLTAREMEVPTDADMARMFGVEVW